MPDSEAAVALTLPIREADDLLWVRQEARRFAQGLDWRPENLMRVDLIVTELATNMCRHAGGGELQLSRLTTRAGLRIVASDQGPGIRNLTEALQQGYSTAGSFGDGLATVQELADRCAIETGKGTGTRITVEKWAP